MIAVAIGEVPSVAIRYGGDNAARMRSFASSYQKTVEKKGSATVDITITGRAFVSSIDPRGSLMEIMWLENPTVETDMYMGSRTKAQHSTLRGVERFVAWAMLNRRPTDREVEFVHEAVLEEVAPKIINPVTGKEMSKRSSMMSVVEMSRCIEHALVLLGLQDISQDVFSEIGGDMHRLWTAWYSWRYSEDDPLFEDEMAMSWDEYREHHPVCEICGVSGSMDNPLERQHVVSGGSDPADYEQPWNWLHAHRSHHEYQHRFGWSSFLNQHPHIKGKVARAREMAQKKGLDVENALSPKKGKADADKIL